MTVASDSKLNALLGTVMTSVSLPSSRASTAVITLVVLAMATCMCAFFEARSLPVSASITAADRARIGGTGYVLARVALDGVLARARTGVQTRMNSATAARNGRIEGQCSPFEGTAST